jgi:hypothetical protein
MEKVNKAKEIFCNTLCVLAYILLMVFEFAFIATGIAILITGEFSVFEVFGMVGCFGAAWMIDGVRRG